MFSLKKNIDKLEGDELRFLTTLDCYRAAITVIHENAVEVNPELTADFGLALESLHCDLLKSPNVEALTQSRTTLVHALADYRDKAGVCLAKREEDLRVMLTSLAEVAETLYGHHDRHSDGIRRFTQHLQVVACGSDLSQMRRNLAEQIAEFKATQEEMSRDVNGLIAGMQKELSEFRERLASTETRAVTDALTGLLNRGEGEARLLAKLKGGQPFSVILADLDRFKQVNDHFGHISGDQVLKSFGRVLAHDTRPSDTVCRWGGDEFLVLLNVDEQTAEQRAIQMREQVKIQCKLMMTGKIYDVSVRASFGLSHARVGDTVEDLLARADTDLYRYKRAGKELPSSPDQS